LALPGSLLRVDPDDTRTTVLAGLTNPTSVVVGHDHDLYISEFGLSPGGGRVLRVATPSPVAAFAWKAQSAFGSSRSPFTSTTGITLFGDLEQGETSLV
jgi:hypothetical protein